MRKNYSLSLLVAKIFLSLRLKSRNAVHGTLDEWLSQWSAKPCTAVRIRQVPLKSTSDFSEVFSFGYICMADNFLEKRQERYNADAAKGQRKQQFSLAAILKRSRSCRAYDAAFIVRADQLRRIVAVNTMTPSSRNRQALRFRLVFSNEAQMVLPHIRLGSALPGCKLPPLGNEPNAYIVVCTTVEPSPSLYIDLGISVQSMLLQAAEMGLNGICIASFDADAVSKALSLPLLPLAVIAVGRGVEKYSLVDISPNDSRDYYRKDGIHYIPKLRLDDLII